MARKAKPKVEAQEYSASLSVLGKVFTATGDSISNAISNLQPGNVRGKAVLTLKRGDKSKERILMPFAVMKLFNTAGLSREVNLKNVSGLFAGFDG